MFAPCNSHTIKNLNCMIKSNIINNQARQGSLKRSHCKEVHNIVSKNCGDVLKKTDENFASHALSITTFIEG